MVEKNQKTSKKLEDKGKKTKKIRSLEVKAQTRFIRMSPKKIRPVIDLIKGKDILEAVDYLKFINKAAVLPISKLLKSALANAEHNFKLDKKNLFIKEIRADGGPTLKRFKPRAFGRATPIRKRTTHLLVVLGVKKGAKVEILKPSKKIKDKKEGIKTISLEELKKEQKVEKEKPKEVEKPKPKEKGFLKKFFSRKAGM